MIGSRISGYLIEGLLAEGGMGQVFKAVHQQLDRPAAIKVLHPHFVKDTLTIARFLQEARAVNLIRHKGLVDIFEIGQLPDGRPFFIMEFLEGETLFQRLSRLGRIPEGDALRIVRQMASALSAAHAQQIAHRDLKPENVMLVPEPELADGERVKILDFGIAKFLEGADLSRRESGRPIRTQGNVLLGTPQYMAPELWNGGQASERVDVYALGVMLYEMLCGRVPFDGEQAAFVMMQHLTAEPPPLSATLLVTEETWQMIGRMMAKEPAARPTMVDIAQQLQMRAPSLTSLPGISSLSALGIPLGGLTLSPSGPSAAAGPLSSSPGMPAVPAPHGEATRPVLTFEPPSNINGQRVARPAWPLRGRTARSLLFALSGGVLAALLLLVLDPDRVPHGGPVHPRSPAPRRALRGVAPPVERARRVRWTLRSEPRGAQVVDARTNTALGLTPWQHEGEASDERTEVVLRLRGYADQRLILSGQADEERDVRLAQSPPPSRSRDRKRRDERDEVELLDSAVGVHVKGSQGDKGGKR